MCAKKFSFVLTPFTSYRPTKFGGQLDTSPPNECAHQNKYTNRSYSECAECVRRNFHLCSLPLRAIGLQSLGANLTRAPQMNVLTKINTPIEATRNVLNVCEEIFICAHSLYEL